MTSPKELFQRVEADRKAHMEAVHGVSFERWAWIAYAQYCSALPEAPELGARALIDAKRCAAREVLKVFIELSEPRTTKTEKNQLPPQLLPGPAPTRT